MSDRNPKYQIKFQNKAEQNAQNPIPMPFELKKYIINENAAIEAAIENIEQKSKEYLKIEDDQELQNFCSVLLHATWQNVISLPILFESLYLFYRNYLYPQKLQIKDYHLNAIYIFLKTKVNLEDINLQKLAESNSERYLANIDAARLQKIIRDNYDLINKDGTTSEELSSFLLSMYNAPVINEKFRQQINEKGLPLWIANYLMKANVYVESGLRLSIDPSDDSLSDFINELPAIIESNPYGALKIKYDVRTPAVISKMHSYYKNYLLVKIKTYINTGVDDLKNASAYDLYLLVNKLNTIKKYHFSDKLYEIAELMSKNGFQAQEIVEYLKKIVNMSQESDFLSRDPSEYFGKLLDSIIKVGTENDYFKEVLDHITYVTHELIESLMVFKQSFSSFGLELFQKNSNSGNLKIADMIIDINKICNIDERTDDQNISQIIAQSSSLFKQLSFVEKLFYFCYAHLNYNLNNNQIHAVKDHYLKMILDNLNIDQNANVNGYFTNLRSMNDNLFISTKLKFITIAMLHDNEYLAQEMQKIDVKLADNSNASLNCDIYMKSDAFKEMRANLCTAIKNGDNDNIDPALNTIYAFVRYDATYGNFYNHGGDRELVATIYELSKKVSLSTLKNIGLLLQFNNAKVLIKLIVDVIAKIDSQFSSNTDEIIKRIFELTSEYITYDVQYTKKLNNLFKMLEYAASYELTASDIMCILSPTDQTQQIMKIIEKISKNNITHLFGSIKSIIKALSNSPVDKKIAQDSHMEQPKALQFELDKISEMLSINRGAIDKILNKDASLMLPLVQFAKTADSAEITLALDLLVHDMDLGIFLIKKLSSTVIDMDVLQKICNDIKNIKSDIMKLIKQNKKVDDIIKLIKTQYTDINDLKKIANVMLAIVKAHDSSSASCNIDEIIMHLEDYYKNTIINIKEYFITGLLQKEGSTWFASIGDYIKKNAIQSESLTMVGVNSKINIKSSNNINKADNPSDSLIKPLPNKHQESKEQDFGLKGDQLTMLQTLKTKYREYTPIKSSQALNKLDGFFYSKLASDDNKLLQLIVKMSVKAPLNIEHKPVILKLCNSVYNYINRAINEEDKAQKCIDIVSKAPILLVIFTHQFNIDAIFTSYVINYNIIKPFDYMYSRASTNNYASLKKWMKDNIVNHLDSIKISLSQYESLNPTNQNHDESVYIQNGPHELLDNRHVRTDIDGLL